jgi:hypothetical protein
MTEQRISELTVDELVALIRKTVQEAMVEVLIEFSVAAQHDADVVYQAEMTDMLRAALQKGLNFDSDEAPLSDD